MGMPGQAKHQELHFIEVAVFQNKQLVLLPKFAYNLETNAIKCRQNHLQACN